MSVGKRSGGGVLQDGRGAIDYIYTSNLKIWQPEQLGQFDEIELFFLVRRMCDCKCSKKGFCG